MEIKEYQEYVRQGASDKYKDLKFAGLALVGEVGEVCDVIKKASIYTDEQKYTDCREKLIEEIGDFIWQTFALLNSLNLTFEEVIEYNVSKLNNRHKGCGLDKKGGIR